MTTAYTSLLGLALPVTGELSGTWGDTVNTAITSLLDTAVAGTTSITTDADITLSTTTGASNEARQAIILWNPASGTTTRNITAPAQSKMYVVINASGGTQSIVIRGAGPTTGVTIAKGESATVAWNGSDFVKVSSSGGAITFTDLTVTGNTILGDAAADTLTVNATSTFAAPVNFQGQVKLPSTGRSAAAALTVTNPAFLYGVASTYTDTTSSGTIAAMAPFYGIAAPTLSTSNVTTYSFASTMYIAGAPAAGGSATITNPYALYVNSGANYFAGATSFGSTLGVTGVTTLTGALLANSNVTLGDAAADNITVTGTITSNLLFTDNTYDIGATAATRPRTGYFGTSVNIQSGQNAYGLLVGPTTGTWSVGGYTGIAFLTRNTSGGGVGGDSGGAYIQGYQPTSGNTGGLKFITRSDASTTTTRYTIDETGISTWAAGSTPLSMTLNGTGLGIGVTTPAWRLMAKAASSGTVGVFAFDGTFAGTDESNIGLRWYNGGLASDIPQVLLRGYGTSNYTGNFAVSVMQGGTYPNTMVERFTIQGTTGNVGIGDTAPANTLVVTKTGGAATVQIKSLTAGQNAQVVLTSTVASWYVGQNITESGTGSLEFYNGSKAMSIASTGAVYFHTSGAASYGTANISAAEPFIRFTDVGGTADKSKWDIRAIAASAAAYDNVLQFRTVNDANSTFRTMATIGWDGVVAVNPDQTNTGPLMRVYGGGTSQRGAYWSSDGTLSGGATNYWEFGRDNATTGDFTFSLNTSTFWRMTTAGQWARTLTSDLTAIRVLGSYTGNPEIIAIGQSSSDGFITIRDAAGNATFLTGYNTGTSYFAGRLSVGTTGTNARFTATTAIDTWVGWFQQRSGSGNSVVLSEYSSGAPNTSTDYFVLCRDTAGQKVQLRANGGIGNFQANDANISDRREKTNFAPAKSYLDVICAIPVQTFNYIDQNMEEDGGLTLGVVAQDVQAVAPELVMESNWGTKNAPKMRLSIYQTDLQYALMKCIQELKAEFDAYKASHP